MLPDGTPIILYGQLYTNYQFTITEVNTYAQKKKNTILSKGNEVIVPASGETAEDIARASAVRKKGVILGGDLNIIVPIPSMNAEFFALSLSNGFPQKKLAQKAQGKSVVHIHNSDIQEISITYPSLEEQNRIASFFRHLDRLITLHQCNCNMATRPCEWSSGLRAIAWEQRKLGEIADIVGGGTPSTNNPSYWNGDIDWYAPAEIGEQIFLTGSQKKITVLGLQKSSATILPVGSVLFTSRAGIGNTAILAKQGATNQGFQSIVPDSQITDSYFIFSRTHELKKYAEIVGAGSTFTEVSGKQMARMPILMPKIDEQVCIGTFFRNLDRLITLHQRKHILLT